MIIHAYSSTNSGDGLLVTEALNILNTAFPDVAVSLVALDPESFHSREFASILHPLSGGLHSISKIETVKLGLVRLVRRDRPQTIAQLVSEADLIVGVGGGYLRAKGPIEGFKMGLTNFVQLPNHAERTPFVYLPQSIGPFSFGIGRLTSRRLARAAVVMGRDDRTIAQLGKPVDATRLPDMAILGLPGVWQGPSSVAPEKRGNVGVVARELGRGRRAAAYRRNLLELQEKVDGEWLTQASARGNNDPDFYRSLGHEGATRSLKDVVEGESNVPPVIVSVRLHGAIQSIRAGVPSVHLSYERKGWGAYEDLGISAYVHNAFDFDLELVVRQTRDLSEDASGYWQAVENALPDIRAKRQRLVDVLRSTVATSRI
ncbi:polysaccharide pyruvyl transferase family protein [Arthrobacter sp. OV608]|uniref:polysaccharide pyruvyl transferase family protein n=1 Tax=Arthrobacter sp. OV608 TaxID=1882768 RepID=UPI0025708C7F|nr:polysaccharide pyruvyl transferase family protein [Arthrobacter sp. OV608]